MYPEHRRVLFAEISGCGLIILVIWLNEILDLPHLLFHSLPTPFNCSEAILESLIIMIFSLGVISFSLKGMNRIKILSGLLPICAGCKKIRVDDSTWVHLEEYLKKHSEAEFTHGICPECEKTFYP